jgi:hypothetical protein
MIFRSSIKIWRKSFLPWQCCRSWTASGSKCPGGAPVIPSGLAVEWKGWVIAPGVPGGGVGRRWLVTQRWGKASRLGDAQGRGKAGCTGLEILDAGAWRRGQEDWLPRRRASEPGCRRETTRLGRVWELPPRASEPVRRRSDDTSWLWEAGSAWEAAHHWRWHRVMAQSLARSTWRRGMPSSAAGAPSHRSNVYAPCPDGAELGDAFLHGVVLAQHHHIWHWARPFLTSGN